MTAAQKRNREIVRKVERTDHWLKTLGSLTALVLLILGALTYIQILGVNGRLEAQIKDHRSDTERTIKSIQEENQRIHAQQNSFLKCILLIQSGQRNEAAIDGCIIAAEREYSINSISSHITAPTPPKSVTNPTVRPEATQPPKEPEQKNPEQPTPTAPPPDNSLSQPSLIERILAPVTGLFGEG